MEEEYKKMIANAKKALDKMIAAEKAGGMPIKELIREGEPVKEVLRVVEDEKTDLIILVAHAEGKIEHFLFSKDTHEMIRQLPCSMVLVKVEPSAIQAPAGVSRRY
jgi:nucleotide-binding universal stress UspA family protein